MIRRLSLKKQKSYQNIDTYYKYKKCEYCDNEIEEKKYNKHINVCKNIIIKCKLCNKHFTYIEHKEHWLICSNRLYKKGYQYGITFNKEFINLCVDKYKEKYNNKIDDILNYNNLLEYEKKKLFNINGIDKEKMMKEYIKILKIEKILCDLVKNL